MQDYLGYIFSVIFGICFFKNLFISYKLLNV